ncbi:hypothetical protein SAMN04487898_12378 [Pedobacter sp. ok626]|nr:hypothetical protein SAMN04487898_12378 [Pedobacter sp. ok626]
MKQIPPFEMQVQDETLLIINPKIKSGYKKLVIDLNRRLIPVGQPAFFTGCTTDQ